MFNSPNGLYQLEYPSNYQMTYEGDILSISPPNNTSCLTVSSYQFNDRISDVEFATLFQKLTIKYEALQEPVFLTDNVIIQRLRNVRPNNDGDLITTFWTICLYRKSKNLLVISVNVPGGEEQKVFEDYQQMLDSIVM